MTEQQAGTILVDLDGTLAYYDHWRGGDHIGEPIPKMLERVKKWIAEGKVVRIFTSRASKPGEEGELAKKKIELWLQENGIGGLEITNCKDFTAIELWDDRAVQVHVNTGIRVDGYE